MVLQELLDSLGIDKKQLAKIAEVSVKTLTRMQDDVEQYVIDAVDEYRHKGGLAEVIPVATTPLVEPVESNNHINDTLPVTHRNIALSRTWHHLDNKQVADRFKLSVFDYNQAVMDTVNHCHKKQTSFIELRA